MQRGGGTLFDMHFARSCGRPLFGVVQPWGRALRALVVQPFRCRGFWWDFPAPIPARRIPAAHPSARNDAARGRGLDGVKIIS